MYTGLTHLIIFTSPCFAQTKPFCRYVDDHRLCCFFETLKDCITLEPQPPLFMCGSLMQNLLLRVSMWILGISALVGNLIALTWRIKEKTRSPTQAVQSFLIGNLAATDFFMGVYMIIIAGADLYYGNEYFVYSDQWRSGAMCRFAGFVSLLSSEGSVFFLTLISIDRVVSVVFPFSKFRLRPKSVKIVGAVLWMASAVLSITPIVLAGPESDFYDLSDVCIGLPLITRPSSYSVETNDASGADEPVANDAATQEFSLSVPQESKPAWYFSIVIFLGVNVVCFFIIALCYVFVFAGIQRSAKRAHGRTGRRQREEARLAFRMAIIVGTDFICWTPVIIMGILSQTGAVVIPLEMYTWSVVFILPINSSLNPYLYTLHSLLSARFGRKTDPGEQSVGQSMHDRPAEDRRNVPEPGTSGTAVIEDDPSSENEHKQPSSSRRQTDNSIGYRVKSSKPFKALRTLREKISGHQGSTNSGDDINVSSGSSHNQLLGRADGGVIHTVEGVRQPIRSGEVGGLKQQLLGAGVKPDESTFHNTLPGCADIPSVDSISGQEKISSD